MAPFGNETHPEPCPGSGAANWNASSFVTGECRSWETITYEPVLDVAWCSFNFDLTSPQTYPFAIYWGIFCSGWRAEAEEATTDATFGLTFLSFH